MRCASRLFLILSLVLAIGLHWAVIQSAAWVGMVVTYTAESGKLATGIQKTFDGSSPCKLCHLVAEGFAKQTSDAGDSGDKTLSKTPDKLDLALFVVPDNPFLTPPQWLARSMVEDFGLSRRDRPVAPPPRDCA